MKVTLLGSPYTYKDEFQILCQQVGDLLQYIIYWKGNFYQNYVEIKMHHKRQSWTPELRKKAYLYLKDMAETTCELLLNQENPELLAKQNEQGAAVLDILEKANQTEEVKPS